MAISYGILQLKRHFRPLQVERNVEKGRLLVRQWFQ